MSRSTDSIGKFTFRDFNKQTHDDSKGRHDVRIARCITAGRQERGTGQTFIVILERTLLYFGMSGHVNSDLRQKKSEGQGRM